MFGILLFVVVVGEQIVVTLKSRSLLVRLIEIVGKVRVVADHERHRAADLCDAKCKYRLARIAQHQPNEYRRSHQNVQRVQDDAQLDKAKDLRHECRRLGRQLNDARHGHGNTAEFVLVVEIGVDGRQQIQPNV